MSESIIVLVNKVIRTVPAVRKYQGDDLDTSMRDHVGSSMCFSLLGTILFLINPWWLLVEICMWIFYAPLTEFVIQEDKNLAMRIDAIWAQVLERSAGFIVLAPLKLLALI